MTKKFRPFIILIAVLLIKQYFILETLYIPYTNQSMPYIEASYSNPEALKNIKSSVEILEKDGVILYRECHTFSIDSETIWNSLSWGAAKLPLVKSILTRQT